MKASRPLIVFLLTIGGISLGSIAYSAQLSISPLTFELTANPGDVLHNKIKIFNRGESAVVIDMESEDFTAWGETGEVRISPAESETYSLASWISISPETFTLGPNEQRFIDFTISVPQNAEPGGKYGSVLASTAGVISPGKEITGVSISEKLGSLILMTVSGNVIEDLQIKEFSAPSFSEYGPIPFLIRFENKGTVHVRPRGFVTVTDWRGNKVADIEFPQQNVIPGAIRRIDVSWDKKWLFGRYTATLIGIYGIINNPIDPPVIVFWAFPWKITLGVLIGLALFLTYFIKTRRRWRMALRILMKGH